MRFLETGTLERMGEAAPRASDVRVVACTNADLQHLAASGLFREDLFYRLKVMHAHLPPLRQRREDIPLLVKHFIARYAKENGKQVTGACEPVFAVLLRHDWPGNVLELKHALEQACLLCESEVLAMHDLPPDLAVPELTPGVRANLNEHAILGALKQASGNKSRAARILGVNRKTLYRKMHKLGIDDQTATRRRKDV
jgi:DNA-binding NtrC family response regulator